MTDKARWVETTRLVISYLMDALILVGAISWIWVDNANWPSRLFWSAVVGDVAFHLIFLGIQRRAAEATKALENLRDEK